jgi:hypothetical protein
VQILVVGLQGSDGRLGLRELGAQLHLLRQQVAQRPAQLVPLYAQDSTGTGKHPDEVTRVLDLLQTVEPLLRRAATHEIDSSASLDEVVATVLRLVQ